MSTWRRFHLDESVRAMAVSDQSRFFVFVREPGNRQPRECYRSDLNEARETADRIVQAYYPHECTSAVCGSWQKLEGRDDHQ
jgi:hypothetical protein